MKKQIETWPLVHKDNLEPCHWCRTTKTSRFYNKHLILCEKCLRKYLKRQEKNKQNPFFKTYKPRFYFNLESTIK